MIEGADIIKAAAFLGAGLAPSGRGLVKAWPRPKPVRRSARIPRRRDC